MDQMTYLQTKKLLDSVSNELRSPDLKPQQRVELERHKAALSGILFSTWLPVPWSRRLIATVIFLLGAWPLTLGHYQSLVFWLVLPFFSLRIVGEIAYLTGSLLRATRDK